MNDKSLRLFEKSQGFFQTGEGSCRGRRSSSPGTSWCESLGESSPRSRSAAPKYALGAHLRYSKPGDMLQSVGFLFAVVRRDEGYPVLRRWGAYCKGSLTFGKRNSTVGANRAIGWLAAAERRSSAVT